MSETPPNTIGYGVVIVPHLDEYQGFFVVDDPALHREAVKLQMMALAVQPKAIKAALEAAVVEGVLTKDWHVTGAAALALHGLTKVKFFGINAQKLTGGTVTEMFTLSAQSVTTAKIEIENLPAVKEIKARLFIQMGKRKQ